MVPAIRRGGNPQGYSRHSACNKMVTMQRLLIILGLALLVAGLAWPWLSKLGLGRLPGDIRIESESGGFYFPLVTCLVISIVLSILFLDLQALKGHSTHVSVGWRSTHCVAAS